MHREAYEFVAGEAARFGAPKDLVIEFGSLDINGSVRGLFNTKCYIGVDLVPGPGVDVQGDAASWKSPRLADVVVCCEVLEHSSKWEEIVFNMVANCKPGGNLIISAATDPRAPHSAVDGGPLREGEYYGNVDPQALHTGLMFHCRSAGIWTDPRGDVYAVAVK